MTWKIIVKPEGKNAVAAPDAEANEANQVEGTNQSGMVIYLTDGSARHEVSRVGFVRRNTKNPKAKFDAQLEKELAKARKSRDLMNGLAETAGELQ